MGAESYVKTRLTARQLQRFYAEHQRNGPLANAEKITAEDLRLASLIEPDWQNTYATEDEPDWPEKYATSANSFNGVLGQFRNHAKKLEKAALLGGAPTEKKRDENTEAPVDDIVDEDPTPGFCSKDQDVDCPQEQECQYETPSDSAAPQTQTNLTGSSSKAETPDEPEDHRRVIFAEPKGLAIRSVSSIGPPSSTKRKQDFPAEAPKSMDETRPEAQLVAEDEGKGRLALGAVAERDDYYLHAEGEYSTDYARRVSSSMSSATAHPMVSCKPQREDGLHESSWRENHDHFVSFDDLQKHTGSRGSGSLEGEWTENQQRLNLEAHDGEQWDPQQLRQRHKTMGVRRQESVRAQRLKGQTEGHEGDGDREQEVPTILTEENLRRFWRLRNKAMEREHAARE
ncbi:uncharacterized protein NECHADRAFT_89411 [Fusarium vanettenii 77-13-4]|uniref:Uncharacterized protein n=1 Tax=Fusarium vanettenii (strain ATCC MYA-4622 / CBS 123669 / FGSC 9596 / NRRL 45880 / 77-13-4) TaxID=660122 RepID=C7ZR26_FUSV7|nr:uncharacterized protein NECHADRAFT_89411 [Fusarium vanettenii 77-13-4]EEU33535.1 predicted protein [Fusarium vanettenii 77-13-4]